MTPKNKLFIGILLLGLIVNLLVIFDLNYFYIRAILAFVFLITVPGLLIMLCLKIRNINFWEYLVYTIGLSVSFIMFAGLAVNWILPFLNITDKPLSLWPILICFDTFLLALWLIAHKRNEDNAHILIFPFEEYEIKGKKRFKFIPKFPSLSWLDRIFIIIPFFFPFMAVIGAFLLNNHGTNIVTMIMLGAIAVYVLLVVIFRDKLNENVFPWALWMIGLALLLSGWMRSWFVSGPDMSLEYWIFQLVKENKIWNIFNFYNSYDAILSLTIFPTILSHFVQINDQFIFKLFIPMIFSIISINIYLISKKILPHIFCFFSGLFFLSMPDFMNWYAIPIRQGIGFIFFGLMLLALFSKEINSRIRNLLFVIFGFSMIVSHYSTSYIALAIFLFTYVLIFFYKKWENRKIKKGKLKPEEKQEFYLSGVIILLLLVFGFLWYSQVTTTSNGFIDFTHKSISNLGNLFNADIRQGGANDPIFGLFNKIKVGNLIEEYKNQTLKYDLSNTSEGFPKESYSQYQIKYLQGNILNPKINFVNTFNLNFYIKQIISKIFQLFILLGLVYFIISEKTEKNIAIIFLGLSMIAFIFLLLPFFSIDYGITRFTTQTMIVLSSLSILGGKIFFEKLKINPKWGVLFLLMLFFLFFSGFSSQLIGGDLAKSQFNNFGDEYEVDYTLNQDFFGVGWLNDNHKNINVYSDSSGVLKINSYGGKFSSYNIHKNLLPNTISRKGYVYLTTINNIRNRGFLFIRNLKLGYNFPTEFLNYNKNKIYNNGGSEIFK